MVSQETNWNYPINTEWINVDFLFHLPIKKNIGISQELDKLKTMESVFIYFYFYYFYLFISYITSCL